MGKNYAQGIGERLREIRGFSSQEEFARKHGATRDKVSDYETERSAPDINYLYSIASKESISLDWLITGKGAKTMRERLSKFTMTLRENLRRNKEEDPKSVVYGALEEYLGAAKIQMRLEATVPAGIDDVTSHTDWPEWMPLDVDPERDVALEVSKTTGESMFPLLRPGDRVIITDRVKPKPGDIVAARWRGNEHGTIKIYQESDNGRIVHLLSYNQAHQPITIPRTQIKLFYITHIIKRRG